MLLIVFIQLLLMSFFPIAIYQLFFAKKRKKLVAIVLILLSLIGFINCKELWPFDFLFQNETRFGYNFGDYRVNILQRPGFDYYDTFYEVIFQNNKKAIILIDPDDHKWWFPKIIQENGKVYFLRYREKPNTNCSYIVTQDSSLYIKGKFYKNISQLDFDSL